jgi:hypothetical protein
MSVRNGLFLVVALCASMFLVACGGGGNSIATGTAPPSGAFSASNLNGAYVFSVSGTDAGGGSYSMAGTLTANGSGGITGGAIDISDLDSSLASAPVVAANAAVSAKSTYNIGQDGRGTITLGVTSNPFNGANIVFDFVLQDSSHGLITGFDGNYSGSGTIDSQTSGITPTGTYAFSLAGADWNSGSPVAFGTVGNFTLSGSAVSTGLEDFNVSGTSYADETITAGTLALGPSSNPSTSLTTGTSLGTLTFDAIAIDANHLKLIEMDSVGNMVGDAYSQTAATISDGNLAFTLAGVTSGGDLAAGGIMVASGGTFANTSVEDYNLFGTTQSISAFTAPVAFSGTYGPVSTDPTNSGRNVINLSSFYGGLTQLAAYPSSGGVLLLEIDGLGFTIGAGYTQSSTSFAAGEGYGLNLSGTADTEEGTTEVDDIAEFTASSSGATITGVVDENSLVSGPNPGISLSGTYTAPDSNGRGQIAYTAETSSNSTLNGAPVFTFYTVDGTTFPFIEADAQGQISTGVFVEQSATSAGSSAAKPVGAKAHSMIVTSPLYRPHVLKNKVK